MSRSKINTLPCLITPCVSFDLRPKGNCGTCSTESWTKVTFVDFVALMSEWRSLRVEVTKKKWRVVVPSSSPRILEHCLTAGLVLGTDSKVAGAWSATCSEWLHMYLAVFMGVLFTITIDWFHHFYPGNVRPTFMSRADANILIWSASKERWFSLEIRNHNSQCMWIKTSTSDD